MVGGPDDFKFCSGVGVSFFYGVGVLKWMGSAATLHTGTGH